MVKKGISLVLCILMLASIMSFALTASASKISGASSFSVKVGKGSGNYKDAIDVAFYCKSDGKTQITTAGCTVVVDTSVIDTFDAETGEVNTSAYLKTAQPFGESMPVEPAGFKSGRKDVSFSSYGSISLCSYNKSSKELYMFVCGISLDGALVPATETKIADLYLKIKDGKTLSKDSIRLMDAKEYKNSSKCPSPAVYPAEISSKQEPADICNNKTINIDESLYKLKGTASESAKPADNTADKKEKTSATVKSSNLKDWLELEINEGVSDKAAADKSTAEYKAYEQALENAKKVLSNPKATDKEKKEALEKLQNAKKLLEEKYGILAKDNAEQGTKKKTVYIIIAVACVVIAAVIAILVIKKRRGNPGNAKTHADKEATDGVTETDEKDNKAE